MRFVDSASIWVSAVGAALAGAGPVATVVSLRRSPEDPGTRFLCHWLGGVSLLVWPLGCTGVSIGLMDAVATSTLALLTVALMNVFAQPIWLLICYTAICKVFFGVSGRVCYAWRQIPEAEPKDVPQGRRRALQRHCVAQGMLMLPFGGWCSLACAWPLLG